MVAAVMTLLSKNSSELLVITGSVEEFVSSFFTVLVHPIDMIRRQRAGFENWNLIHPRELARAKKKDSILFAQNQMTSWL